MIALTLLMIALTLHCYQNDSIVFYRQLIRFSLFRSLRKSNLSNQFCSFCLRRILSISTGSYSIVLCVGVMINLAASRGGTSRNFWGEMPSGSPDQDMYFSDLASRIYTRLCKIHAVFRVPDQNHYNLYPFSGQNG